MWVIVLATVASCGPLDIEKDTPKCVQRQVRDFSRSSNCVDAKVDEFYFQEKTVYVFDPGSCGNDMQAGVIDNNCKALGDLGGIAGNTEINGEKFSNAVFVKTIWKK